MPDEEHAKRKLTAILCADLVGYVRKQRIATPMIFLPGIVALVFLLSSVSTLLAREEGSFAVLGSSEVLVERGAVVRGGDVGVIGTPRGEGQIIVLGAHIKGDVYGPSVRLDEGAKVHNVFTNDLQAGKAKYRSLESFPDDLPRAAVSPIIEPETNHFIVPTGTTALLSGHPRWVEVHEGATLIVPVGEHFLDVLSLGANCRLESAGPSRLLISSRLEVGPRSFIGPAETSRGDLRDAANLGSGDASDEARGIGPAEEVDLEVDTAGRLGLVRGGGGNWGELKKRGLNLTIVVAGPDRRGFAQAVIGRESLVSAVVVVPEGTLRLEQKVRAIGTFFADKVSIGPGAVVDHPKYLGYSFDERCRVMVCEVEAISGGTINWSCSRLSRTHGTGSRAG
ncbi:MAG: hypothetical protein JRK53_03675 [Deltaproteobacteria bacterium]|nr:hypothetical protein [Deltaproteobacteria bacterium]